VDQGQDPSDHPDRSVSPAFAVVRQCDARDQLSRRQRTWCELDKTDRIWVVGGGPPELSLDHRRPLLEQCRKRLSECGFVIAAGWKGILRWREKANLLDARLAEDAALADEREADLEDGHWWLHDLMWSDGKSSVVVAIMDPDGNDLNFVGWGAAAPGALNALAALLVEHTP